MKIAVLGAESTGKSTLTTEIVHSLNQMGSPTVGIGEYLREWCLLHKRTPKKIEQWAIAYEQAKRIDQTDCANIVADTAPLMTAIYSDVLFNDQSLYEFSIHHLARFSHILVTGLDLPWVEDNFLRDGMAAQKKIDEKLHAVLRSHQIPYAMVYGFAGQRTLAALSALRTTSLHPHCSGKSHSETGNDCEHCSDALYEQKIFNRLLTF